MQHRHLLPNEIDLLLDSEVGFGMAPLKAHAESCAACTARVDDARRVTAALDDLPRFAPAPSFANRVMAQVQVVEPWHVALTSAAMRLVPKTTPMRVVMAASASVIAVGISSAAVWLAFRADVAMYLAGLADERLRQGLTAGAASLAGAIFGNGAATALSTQGTAAVVAGMSVLVLGAGAAMLGLRALASASRRARE